jgi:hypothetical protein
LSVNNSSNASAVTSGFSSGFSAASLLCFIQHDNYTIGIVILKLNATETQQINTTVNQTTGIDANGNNITTPVNVSTGQTQQVNVLQQVIDGLNTSFGKPNQYQKNGYTYYQFSPKTSNNFTIGSQVFNYTDGISNSTLGNTLIVKDGYPYLFWIDMYIHEPNGTTNDTEALNTYNQILNTFKIGGK